jgi:hypothetical protein
MTKRNYLQPAMKVVLLNTRQHILTDSVKTTGLDDPLKKGGSGDSWGGAMGRRNNAWDDEEEEEDF